MIVSPVARRSVADQVFDQLLEGILDGELAPGSQLPPERELAAQAGVNRQALREALQRLRQMDLVEIVHGGGVRVNDWRSTAGLALLPHLVVRGGRAVDGAVARSIMELRVIIGADAARWCATRADAEAGARLAEIVAEMETRGSDPDRWGSIGFDFWEAVVIGADNIGYRLAFNTLRAVAGAAESLLPGILGAEWALRDGYQEIARAITDGDAEAAEASARDLLGVGVALVEAYLSSNGGEIVVSADDEA